MSIESTISNKDVLQSMVEHRAEQLLDNIDALVLPLFAENPAIGRVASTFITVKKREFIPKIQEYCDLLVETACLEPDITLKAAITNAENILNDSISEGISKKLELPLGIVNISLQALFGDTVIKL